MKKKILYIIATPREDESRTLKVAEAFLHSFREKYPEFIVDELDLSKEPLPSMNLKAVSGKYVLLEGKNLFGELKETWNEIIRHIDRFKSANVYLIASPMWNFSIPYTLKQYIDVIVQPKYLFEYKEGTTEGLVKGKKMVIAISRGGAYPKGSEHDFQISYLRTIFNFVGIDDISFVLAEGMDIRERQAERLDKAIETAKRLGEEIGA